MTLVAFRRPPALLDLTYGEGGKVLTDIGGSAQSDVGRDVVAYQSDGKLVVLGDSYNGTTGNDFSIFRYNADGSLDGTFGTAGNVTIDFGNFDDYGRSVAIDSQGRIVVAGNTYRGSSLGHAFAVARLTPDGDLDGDFDGDGKKLIGFGSTEDLALGVAVDSQDRVLVAGYSIRVRPP